MANIFRYFTSHNLALAISLGSFAHTYSAQPVLNFKSINSVDCIRIEKLINGVRTNFAKKDKKKLVSTMLDLKSEAEKFTSRKFDINAIIDSFFIDLKDQGFKIDKKFQNSYKNVIESEKKCYEDRLECMQNYFLNRAVCNYFGEKSACIKREPFSIKCGKYKKENKDIDVPLKLVLGASYSLCGFFLIIIPLSIPAKEKIAFDINIVGLKYVVDSIIELQDEENRKKIEMNLRICNL